MYTGATSVCKEEDGVEIEMWMVRITLWRTETELQTEVDEGGPWKKLEVQTDVYINYNKDSKQLSGQHKVGPALLQKP